MSPTEFSKQILGQVDAFLSSVPYSERATALRQVIKALAERAEEEGAREKAENLLCRS